MELFNNEAEVSVLGLVINNPDLVYSIAVKPYMLSSTLNQVLLSNILELSEQALIPEYNLVINYLKAKGKLNDAGGEEYLKYLREQSLERENFKAYESQVINSYKAKTLLQLGAGISSRVKDSPDIESYISEIRDTLDKLTTTSGGETTSTFEEVLKGTWEAVVDRQENPGIPGVTTGYSDLDAITGGYKGGDLYVVAARPSVGKTAWMCNSILKSAKVAPVCVFSLEMIKQALGNRFVAIQGDLSVQNISLGVLSKEELQKLSDTVKEIKSLPIYIDDIFTPSLNYLVQTIRKYVRTKGVKVVFIDYIQILVERGEFQTHEIGKVSRALKLLARELDIAVVILSQLNRSLESHTVKNKRPGLADLRQSGNLEEDADVVMFLYRDELYNPETKNKGEMEQIIRKNRNGMIGTLPHNHFEAETNKIT